MGRLRFTFLVAAGAVVILWGRPAITEEPQSIEPDGVAVGEFEQSTEPPAVQVARDWLNRIGLLAQRPDQRPRDRQPDRPQRPPEEIMERVMEHLRMAVGQLEEGGYSEIAQALANRAEQIHEQLQQRRRPRDEDRGPRGPEERDRRGPPEERGPRFPEDRGRRGPPEERDRPSPIQQAIDILRETGHGEAARGLASTVEELHAALRQRPGDREPRRDQEFAPVHPEINHAIRQLLDDVRHMKDNPPVHPEINHVLQDLRREVEDLRRQVDELRRRDEPRER